MSEENVIISKSSIPNDTMLASQWYLGEEAYSLNIRPAWQDYTGAGIRIGVIDDGFDSTHVDLAGPYNEDLDYDSADNDTDATYEYPLSEKHGTAVMGVIAADDNGIGIVGVAYDAELIGYRFPYSIPGAVDVIKKATLTSDIINASWGFTTPFSDDFQESYFSSFKTALIDASTDGRNGLGSVMITSAGNHGDDGDHATYHNFPNSPYVIAVGSMDKKGFIANSSSHGSAVLVAAPGVEILTTDLTGSYGHSSSDYATVSGTSVAAPMVSGIVALMLEANPNLGYRDVQEILAYSARMGDRTDGTWRSNAAKNWNGGGLHFNHNGAGFGLVDAHAAVRLAETWDTQMTAGNLIEYSTTKNLGAGVNLPDLQRTLVTFQALQNVKIEQILVDIDLSHGRTSDLEISLISPAGIVRGVTSTLYDNYAGSSTIDFQFSTVAHWGEDSLGQWTLSIDDSKSGFSGTLRAAKITFLGKEATNDDRYIYTDELPNIPLTGSSVLDNARKQITDTNGGHDILNLAATTSNNFVDLSGVQNSTIVGKTIDITDGTLIEELIGGDGNDMFFGAETADIISGGRGDDMLSSRGGNDILSGGAGNDVLIGGAGDDMLDGGEGLDTASYQGAFANFVITNEDEGSLRITDTVGDSGSDILKSIETLLFSNGIFDAILKFFSPVENEFSIVGTDSAETIRGTSGADTIFAKSGNDTVVGYAGDDYISGGAGNDMLQGGEGADILDGGDGTDRAMYTYAAASVVVNLLDSSQNTGDAAGDVYISIEDLYGSKYNDTLIGDAGANQIYGYLGNDHIYGNEGADFIHGQDGDDIIEGGADNDRIYGGNGKDELHGGEGHDTLNGGNDDDTMYGDEGHDRLYGYYGNDVVYGGNGNDRLYGQEGDDILYGEGDHDKLYGHAGNDILYGGDGNDYLVGYDGNDTLNGDAGVDKLYGQDGDDVLNGGADADYLYGNDGNDILNGGTGNDHAVGGSGNDTINGDEGDDRLYGQDGDDIMNGGDGIDTLNGGIGNDTMYGGAGSDIILGDTGDDILRGGLGYDRLYGQAGADTYVIDRETLSDGFVDGIFTFNAAEGDKIDVSDVLENYDPLSDAIADFVKVYEFNAESYISLDASGQGNFIADAVSVRGVTGLGSAQDLLDNGTLIV